MCKLAWMEWKLSRDITCMARISVGIRRAIVVTSRSRGVEIVGDGRQVEVDGHRRARVTAGTLLRDEREVEPRVLPADPAGLAVVRQGGLLGGAVRAEPGATPQPRVPDLRGPPA